MYIMSVFNTIKKIKVIHFDMLLGIVPNDELLINYSDIIYACREINKFFRNRNDIVILTNNKPIINIVCKDINFTFMETL